MHDAGNRLFVLRVIRHLQFGHRHEDGLIEPAGELVGDDVFFAPQENGLERAAELVEIAIAGHLADFVDDLVLVHEAIGRAEAEAVDKLNDGDKLFQAVLQGRAGEDDGIRRLHFFDGPGHARGPVLDTLRFVQNHQVGSELFDEIEVRVDGVIIEDLVRRRILKLTFALRAQPGDDLRRALGEFLDFALPLVLERRRAKNENAFDAEMSGP